MATQCRTRQPTMEAPLQSTVQLQKTIQHHCNISTSFNPEACRFCVQWGRCQGIFESLARLSCREPLCRNVALCVSAHRLRSHKTCRKMCSTDSAHTVSNCRWVVQSHKTSQWSLTQASLVGSSGPSFHYKLAIFKGCRVVRFYISS